jgi:CheY-like chemotaxis protein
MNKNILIVEDDPFTQHFYKYVFSKAGYTVTITEEGEAILGFLKDGKSSIVLMDINLRNTFLNDVKMDGVQLSKIIKSDKDLSHIPVILITAYQIHQGENNFFQESLADDYITKPIIDFNELLRKVENLLNRNE